MGASYTPKTAFYREHTDRPLDFAVPTLLVTYGPSVFLLMPCFGYTGMVPSGKLT